MFHYLKFPICEFNKSMLQLNAPTCRIVIRPIQWGLKYQTFKFRIHSKTKCFKSVIKWFGFWMVANFGSVFEWSGPFNIRTMVSLGHFTKIIFFKYLKRPRLRQPFWMFGFEWSRPFKNWTPFENLFGIRAPTVLVRTYHNSKTWWNTWRLRFEGNCH